NPLRQMAWGVLAVIGLHSLLEYPLWYGPFQIAAALAVWLLWAPRWAVPAWNDGFSSKFKRNSRFAQYLPALLAMIMIVVLAVVAISYDRVSQIYLPPDQRRAAYRDDTLAKVRSTWLFRDQARFAELSIMPLTPENAAYLHAMAMALLHYSPEPRVIEKVIESAVMLGRPDEALYYLVRYRAAFPKEHARWAQKNAAPPALGAQGRPQALQPVYSDAPQAG
ncbi:MAG: O-antigen polymerase, partial [Polaromonas sp.]|nr:O-antigen polymerase [Polaromonas sp.]